MQNSNKNNEQKNNMIFILVQYKYSPNYMLFCEDQQLACLVPKICPPGKKLYNNYIEHP